MIVPPHDDARGRVRDRLPGAVQPGLVACGVTLGRVEHGVVELAPPNRSPEPVTHPADDRRAHGVARDHERVRHVRPQVLEGSGPRDLDVMAECFEHRARAVHRFRARGVYIEPRFRIVVEEPDAKWPGGGGRHGAGQSREHRAEIFGVPGEHEVAPRRIRRLTGRWYAADSTRSRVERGESAQCRRTPERAGRVGAVRDRHHSARDRRRRAAAGAAGRSSQVPRIPRRLEAARFGGRTVGEGRARALADDREAGALEPFGERGCGRGSVARIAERGDADPVRRSRELLAGVLQQHRHAAGRAVEQRDDDGVDDAVVAFDALDCRRVQLGRGHGPIAQHPGLRHCADPSEVVHAPSVARGRVRGRVRCLRCVGRVVSCR